MIKQLAYEIIKNARQTRSQSYEFLIVDCTSLRTQSVGDVEKKKRRRWVNTIF